MIHNFFFQNYTKTCIYIVNQNEHNPNITKVTLDPLKYASDVLKSSKMFGMKLVMVIKDLNEIHKECK